MAAQETSFPTTQTTSRPSALPPPSNSANVPELASIAKELGKYQNSSPDMSVYFLVQALQLGLLLQEDYKHHLSLVMHDMYHEKAH